MQLRMPLFEVVQKGFGFLSGQETQSFIVGFDHFPSTALGGQRVDSAPHAGGNSTVYGGTHERKDVVHGLSGQSFPFPRLGVGLSCGFFGLCIPGGRLQELRLEAGKQIRGQLDKLGKEVCPLLSGVAGRMPLLCLPTVFQCPLPSWSAYQKQ